MADELVVEFEGLPDALERKVGAYLSYFASPTDEIGVHAQIKLTASPPPRSIGRTRKVLSEEELLVSEDAESILFELPGITAWVRPAERTGGIWLDRPTEEVGDRFVGLALAPMLIELAQAVGFLGIHAAAVAVDGRGILLPGPSGCGKSTLFRSCARAGLDVLSDDLVWISSHPSASGDYSLYPFPRGGYAEQAPNPTVSTTRLTAIVSPSIVDREDSQLSDIDPAEALDALLAESGFLAWRRGAAQRFSLLTRLAGARPAFRLEAGRRKVDVPALLTALVAGDAGASS